jgi:hypothetical protein
LEKEGVKGDMRMRERNVRGCGLIKDVVGFDISWNWWNAMAL